MTLANMAAMKRAGADRVIFGRSFFDTDARQRPEFIKSARRP
jgi:pentose-5-phosphate-3-epimerase